MNLDEAVDKLKQTGGLKFSSGNIWYMTLPGGEKMLALACETYHSSVIIDDENQLKTKLENLLNKVEIDTDGDISCSSRQIKM